MVTQDDGLLIMRAGHPSTADPAGDCTGSNCCVLALAQTQSQPLFQFLSKLASRQSTGKYFFTTSIYMAGSCWPLLWSTDRQNSCYGVPQDVSIDTDELADESVPLKALVLQTGQSAEAH